MTYAGIGSRETPPHVLHRMVEIGLEKAMAGWVLRSGGAPGADTAFEVGCDLGGGAKEIYLPWRGFNDNRSPLCAPTDVAYGMAAVFHPTYFKLSNGAKALMARNCHQVLGANLNTPVDLIICWTPDGKASGGTGQALRIAEAHGIRVINLAVEEL